MKGKNSKVRFSCDIDEPLQFHVHRLEGVLPDHSPSHNVFPEKDRKAELFVECALYITGIKFGLTYRTRLASEGPPYHWNKHITLPSKYQDLSPDSQIAFTVWDVSRGKDKGLVGGATIPLFDNEMQLISGTYYLRLHAGKEADGHLPTTTPGEVPMHEWGETERLEKLVNKYERGLIPRVDWLDRLTFKSIEKIKKREASERGNSLEVVFQGLGENDLKPSTNDIVKVLDPEIGRSDPYEEKHLKMANSWTRDLIDRDLKPISNERKSIERVLKYHPTKQLSEDERQLLWKFRFYLKSQKKALTKFLCCVQWSNYQEAKQALELMWEWEMIDVCDALELLSPVYERKEVRAYAVSVLQTADAEELQCYLLPLVQALRFERSDNSCLSQFLVGHALHDIEFASFLRWYVTAEVSDPLYAKRLYSTYEALEKNIMKGDDDGAKLWLSLTRQKELTDQLCSVTREIRGCLGNTQRKTEKLRELLFGMFSECAYFKEPIRSPLAPKELITGILPSESSVFESQLNTLLLTFRTANGGTCKIIYKEGDDIRQDQLVVQMVSLMDQLLKLENFDLRLTLYKVLATGQEEGMLEYIPSYSLAQILSDHGSIIGYLQKIHPDDQGPFGITAACLDTFIRSCAGYSVITYILGIGDRNLDNLLLRDDGRLFYVDFGCILGRDPEPFSPQMKLCKEMVEAIWGEKRAYTIQGSSPIVVKHTTFFANLIT